MEEGLPVSAETIEQLRSRIQPAISAAMSDMDCIRFIRARNGDLSKAVDMINAWWTWRNTELPGSHTGVTPANLLRTTNDKHLLLHPQKMLIPHMLHGEDKAGRPVYWERTGKISANYTEVKKIWDVDDLIQMHIRSMEITELRLQHASEKYGRSVTKSIVVLDLADINMKPDFQAISYSRRQLQIDQNFYPERLYRFFIINAPWFFTAIFALISPFMDSVTRAKIQILGGKDSYMPALLEVIDISEIPVELGGEMENCPWCGPFLDKYGCSEEQINAKVAEMELASRLEGASLDDKDAVTSSSSKTAASTVDGKSDLEELS